MAASTKTVVCPNCEGVGREVNRFDPPIDIDKYFLSHRVRPADERFTSEGREYLKGECHICDGRGLAVVAAGGA